MSRYQQLQETVFNQLEKDAKKGNASATFVEPLSDYAGDQQMCLTSVAFLPPVLCQVVINKIIKPLKKVDDRQYYFPSNSLHVTIQNIRVISSPLLFTADDIEKAKQIFHKVTAKYSPLILELKGILELPNSLSIRGYSDKIFGDFVLELRAELKKAGIPDNKKYASKNVVFGNSTICRFTKEPTKEFFAKVKELKNIEIGKFEIKTVSLITTNAVCHPDKTKIIETYNLR